MAKILKGFLPNFKIHKVCATDDLRPAMYYVFFKHGNAYATDAYKAVSAPLSIISNFTDEEKELLEGKVIHGSQFAKLLTMRNIEIELFGENLCFNCYTKEGENVIIPILDEEKIGKFPNVEGAINKAEKEAKDEKLPVNMVGLNARSLSDLASAINANIIDFYFTQANHAIVVRNAEYPEIRAIMMPYLINDPIF